MKKGDIVIGTITKMYHPADAVMVVEDKEVIVKKAIIGQTLECMINKKKKDKIYARVLKVIKESDYINKNIACNFDSCGGCTFQGMKYEDQLSLKEEAVKFELDKIIKYDYTWEKIIPSPNQFHYRNKMEYSFGDEYKGGDLVLGLHKKNNFYDIVATTECNIVHDDFNIVLKYTMDFFRSYNISFFHKITHTGILRHLLLRRSFFDKEMLIMLSVSELDFIENKQKNDFLNIVKQWSVGLLKLNNLEAKIVGIIYSVNNSFADAIKEDYKIVLYGREYIYETLNDLKFKISTYSFFQTNSSGANLLYDKIGDYIGETKDKIVFDLYSGTGTIAQLVARYAKKVYAIEIVDDAVVAARENAKINNIHNCEFISGDVLKKIDEIINVHPDIIILDPPRDGINSKALDKIMNNYVPDKFVYVACKPSSFFRDYVVFENNGYMLDKVCCVDMFCNTPNLEMVALLSKKINL